MGNFILAILFVHLLVTTAVASAPPLNLNRLAYCVAQHETHNGKLGSGRPPYNNAFGIKQGRRFVRYNTLADSYTAFKSLWTTRYGGLPTLAMARRYSGNDRARAWQRNVMTCYHSAPNEPTYNF